jgi:hypothetical protein
MIRLPRPASTAAALLAAVGLLAVAAPAASAAVSRTGDHGDNCVNALIAANNWNNSALSADGAGNATGAAADDGAAYGYLYSAEVNCYYTPSATAYQDTVQASTYNSAAESANQSGDISTATSDEQAVSSYINDALTIEESYGYV